MKIIYANLGLDYFGDIHRTIAENDQYKKCIDQYIKDNTLCGQLPSADTVSKNFKESTGNNVGKYYSCNSAAFMPFILSMSKSLLDIIYETSADLFIAGEMCEFDYNENYKNKMNPNSFKKYIVKQINSNTPSLDRITPSRSGENTKNLLTGADVMSRLPDSRSNIDSNIFGFIKDSKIEVSVKRYEEIRNDSYKAFFIGVINPKGMTSIDEIMYDCDICDELQITRMIYDGEPYIIVNVHNRKYAVEKLARYISPFCEIIRKIKDHYKDENIIVVGDFNIGPLSISQYNFDRLVAGMKEVGLDFVPTNEIYTHNNNTCPKSDNVKNENILVFHRLNSDKKIVLEILPKCDHTVRTSAHYPFIINVVNQSQYGQTINISNDIITSNDHQDFQIKKYLPTAHPSNKTNIPGIDNSEDKSAKKLTKKYRHIGSPSGQQKSLNQNSYHVKSKNSQQKLPIKNSPIIKHPNDVQKSLIDGNRFTKSPSNLHSPKVKRNNFSPIYLNSKKSDAPTENKLIQLGGDESYYKAKYEKYKSKYLALQSRGQDYHQ